MGVTDGTIYISVALRAEIKKEVKLLKKEKNGIRLHRLFAVIALVLISAIMLSSFSYSEVDAAPVSSYMNEAELASFANNYSQSAGVSYGGGKINYSLPGVSSKNLWSYNMLSVYVNGVRLSDYGAVINGITYLPVRAYFEALGAKVSYNSSSRILTASASGLYFTAVDGGYTVTANDRPLFSFSPNVIMSNGRMYAPMSALTKASGQSGVRSTDTVNVSGTFSPLRPSASYYREDEVFWLARIITAEARGESLLGQIAVGDVIMNRVRSSLYPNTIYGVIFDRKYGVQFSPIIDGSIYNTPTYTATLAAKIILEGTSLTDNAMFFLNPRTAESSWIVKSREYGYTIGGHDFYY